MVLKEIYLYDKMITHVSKRQINESLFFKIRKISYIFPCEIYFQTKNILAIINEDIPKIVTSVQNLYQLLCTVLTFACEIKFDL